MNGAKLTNDNLLVHTIDGTEDTEKILSLCQEMECGKYVKVNSRDYNFCELPEFLATVNNMCQIKLADIYNHYEKVIQYIWRIGVEQSGGKVEDFVKTKILKSK